MIKPTLPKGTRDFSPDEMAKRNYLFGIIRNVFELHGFAPLETPAMENLETLTGKYGEEGDQLIFKILDSGNFLSGVTEGQPLPDHKTLASKIAGKALRYDLTVPFARFVVARQNELAFPFRRYQIQPVWRADRPQKGRYREFYQCDADIIGSDSLMNEAELVHLFDEVFAKLKLPVVIKINNRKILQGIAEHAGVAENFQALTVAIDKLEKAGPEKVKEEMAGNGFPEEAILKIFRVLAISGKPEAVLNELTAIGTEETLQKGIEEVSSMLKHCGVLQHATVELDLSLARGLEYYTGCIFEVKALLEDYSPSLCGGGRYDDLTGIFGMKGISGVGISFGADRIYDVLQSEGLFPEISAYASRIMFVNFGEAEAAWCMKTAQELRKSGIAVEVYPDAAKVKKQMAYASARKIPFVAFAGTDEIAKDVIKLKNMNTGAEEFVSRDKIASSLADTSDHH